MTNRSPQKADDDVNRLVIEHRPNVVTEEVGPTPLHWRTRVKCDGDGCHFSVERDRYWDAVAAHSEHLTAVLSEHLHERIEGNDPMRRALGQTTDRQMLRLEAQLHAARSLTDDWLTESQHERMVPVSALQAVRDVLATSPAPAGAVDVERSSHEPEKNSTIHERLAVIVGCSVDDERLDDLYEFIQSDRQIEAGQTWDQCAREAHDLGWLHDSALSDLLARNPHRVLPPDSNGARNG